MLGVGPNCISLVYLVLFFLLLNVFELFYIIKLVYMFILLHFIHLEFYTLLYYFWNNAFSSLLIVLMFTYDVHVD